MLRNYPKMRLFEEAIIPRLASPTHSCDVTVVGYSERTNPVRRMGDKLPTLTLHLFSSILQPFHFAEGGRRITTFHLHFNTCNAYCKPEDLLTVHRFHCLTLLVEADTPPPLLMGRD